VSITGAITALGDTLYPVEAGKGLAERIATDQSATASFFERGRSVHPLVAIVVAGALLVIFQRTRAIRPYASVERAVRSAMLLVYAQVAAGVVNILLSAPAYMQVIHLAVATVLWLSLVLLYATAMAEKRT
jgi:heme A synthase